MLCLSSHIYKRKNNYRYVISQGLFFDFGLDIVYFGMVFVTFSIRIISGKVKSKKLLLF